MDVQAKARSSALYLQDLYAWSERQASLLRRQRFSELDLEHVVEEIEDVGGSLYREVRSRIRTIMEHLLQLEHSAATERSRGQLRLPSKGSRGGQARAQIPTVAWTYRTQVNEVR